MPLPPEVYEAEVEGVPTTKVRLVVGRQNQNREANLEYAKRLKAVADKLYPGLVEGIFDAKGNYNQDLGPKTILLEFGAHTNRLDHAKQAAEFFAKVVPAAAGLTPSTKEAAQEQIGSGASRSLVWTLLIAGGVGAAFLLIKQGGSEPWAAFSAGKRALVKETGIRMMSNEPHRYFAYRNLRGLLGPLIYAAPRLQAVS